MRSNTYSYAERELNVLVQSSTDPDNRPIIEPFIPEILALCDKFGNSGQSGGSAPYTAAVISRAIKKLLLQEPICEITGIEDEWVDVTEYNDGKSWFQNRRCSALFKEGAEGNPYYLDAIIWKDEKDHTYAGSALLNIDPNSAVPVYEKITSRQTIKSFPFTPKTFYIDVISKEVAPGDWDFYVKDPNQLKKVWKYYNKYE